MQQVRYGSHVVHTALLVKSVIGAVCVILSVPVLSG